MRNRNKSLRASQFGAIHRRERIFIIAYNNDSGHLEQQLEIDSNETKQQAFTKLDSSVREGAIGYDGGFESDSKPKTPRGAVVSTPRACFVADDWSDRIQRYQQETTSREFGFSQFKDVRRIEDLFNRPNLPEPLFRNKNHGFSSGLGVCGSQTKTEKNKKEVIPINGYGSTKEIPEQELRMVWEQAGAKGYERTAGRLQRVQTEGVLQHEMRRVSEAEGICNSLSLLETSPQTSQTRMRNVRCNREPPHTPQEWRLVGQHTGQSCDSLRLVPLETPLEEWENTMEKAVCLRCLWDTCEEVGLVSKTLSAFKEVWESQNDEDKRWLLVQTNSGRNVVMDRIKMTRAIGNAVVPVCAQFIARQIKDAEAKE
ncbi:MAG: hypothetical protein UX13_C0003G0010 [Candidatus Woesebacteria bacterium GW2011_GWB1_45_5]|uniref:DNA (cytosine-5-)-methyltransferase n=1 Tax=Candidatus Woesebacteria bacterium GW2011_GWB1_45_5 TaxID=1618581 RepID=A0A0G1PZA8_9BACT|nr:MAG: hypothetical protein UX13_C0003G0010 [Candidatus Woesebacteria bacterium GW2011_GWB1_45_5]